MTDDYESIPVPKDTTCDWCDEHIPAGVEAVHTDGRVFCTTRCADKYHEMTDE